MGKVDVLRCCFQGMCELAGVNISFCNRVFLIVFVYKPNPFSTTLKKPGFLCHVTGSSCISDLKVDELISGMLWIEEYSLIIY